LSNFIVDPYFFVPSVCEDTNSETQGGSGATGWGVSGTQILGVGMSFDAGHYLIGKEILNVTFWLRMNTSGSGDTNAHLWNGSSRTSPRATSDAVSTSAIGTGLTEIKYTFSSPATLQAGDYMTADGFLMVQLMKLIQLHKNIGLRQVGGKLKLSEIDSR